jgi:hypothetical protein
MLASRVNLAMSSYMTQNTHDSEDTESRFWRSYLDLKRATPPLAVQPLTEAVAVDVHCLVSLHVTASVGVLLIVQRVGSYERAAQQVETVSRGLVRG